ncbi:MAG: hypothetical protein ACI4PF_05985 [Christensenellales bacterium]
MKEKFLKFIKDKFNITLIIIQVLAIICYALSFLGAVVVGLFFTLEGVFFIVWGIKILRAVKYSFISQEIYNQLPYTEEQRIALRKKTERNAKNNRFIGVTLIILGIVLFFSVFSLIF